LDSVKWLCLNDRNALYNSHVCTLAILKASVCLDLTSVPPAYPLPYGEYLGEIEALHLILAHDLYNELLGLMVLIQKLDIKEFPVMLLIMMITFFDPNVTSPFAPPFSGPSLFETEKVVRVHDYYTHKLQSYLSQRYGSSTSMIMSSILATMEKVRVFSERLREFLRDVTNVGLQKQYESVCENLGLMAFLLQAEPSSSCHNKRDDSLLLKHHSPIIRSSTPLFN